MGLDNLSDVFRLDCRAADQGCTTAAAASSWHGRVHLAAGLLGGIATIAAPYVPATRMRHAAGVTWPGQPSSPGRCWSPSWPPTLRSRSTRILASIQIKSMDTASLDGSRLGLLGPSLTYCAIQ
jgi:hypothetical protein